MRTNVGMMKVNIKQSKIAYWITGLLLLLVIANEITIMAVFGLEDHFTLAIGNYLCLLPLLMAVFIPALNFSKLMNLGGKRKDFFSSSISTYVTVVTFVMLINLVLHFTLDSFLLSQIAGVMTLLDVFGFMEHGPVSAFFQMWAFLTLFCCVLHTLTLIQGRWYGWVVNLLIVAIISVFTPIAPLREALVWFFNLIIFHEMAIVQILSCLIIAAAVYCASLIPIKYKQI